MRQSPLADVLVSWRGPPINHVTIREALELRSRRPEMSRYCAYLGDGRASPLQMNDLIGDYAKVAIPDFPDQALGNAHRFIGNLASRGMRFYVGITEWPAARAREHRQGRGFSSLVILHIATTSAGDCGARTPVAGREFAPH